MEIKEANASMYSDRLLYCTVKVDVNLINSLNCTWLLLFASYLLFTSKKTSLLKGYLEMKFFKTAWQLQKEILALLSHVFYNTGLKGEGFLGACFWFCSFALLPLERWYCDTLIC